MIEIYLLEQLDAFARNGTLSAASCELRISQPALTRSMKRLEEEMGVALFDRKKNRLSLNENGKLAASQAALILEQDRELVERVRAFDRRRRTILLGCCSPMPSYLLTPMLQHLYPEMTISSEIAEEDHMRAGLLEGTYQLAVFHEKPTDPNLSSIVCGAEQLCVSVPPASPLALCRKIRFADLEGVPMLQYADVGFWYDLCREKIPNPRLLLQDNRETFLELADASALPRFCSRAFNAFEERDVSSRKIIPIADPEASVTYWLACRRQDTGRFRGILHKIAERNRDAGPHPGHGQS